MRDVQYRYRVIQHVAVYVWAPNEEGALYRSAHVVMGPWWQHIWLLRWIPWARKPVKSVGEFRVEKLPGVR